MGKLKGIDGLKDQVQQCIQFAYDKGVKAGREMQDRCGEEKQKWIEQGRNEAWEAARKLRLSRVNDPSMAELRDMFNVSILESDTDILKKFSASKAIEKIRAWEEKKAEDDEICVGDEVCYKQEYYHEKFVVVSITDDGYLCGINKKGIWNHAPIKDLRKTGRHFDQITEVLEKMKTD